MSGGGNEQGESDIDELLAELLGGEADDPERSVPKEPGTQAAKLEQQATELERSTGTTQPVPGGVPLVSTGSSDEDSQPVPSKSREVLPQWQAQEVKRSVARGVPPPVRQQPAAKRSRWKTFVPALGVLAACGRRFTNR